ncbi:TonB-dependent receptor-like protein [Arcticibacter pallidicorallinus]|uniref:TonB-dependent receptor-like protein n=2 Tax=Arcticibacter pallidicorallinus TaxID=1259464 RepID=A0A2T0U7C3_9SPHI|nr:TonB-dependent receptor-like protein [Arcticibacter pallidicorallinus]
MSLFKTLAGIWFILLAIPGYSQEKPGILISGKLENAKVGEFIDFLNSATGYQIYYDQTKFDSLRVNLEFTNKNIDWVLDQAFKNTQYRYAIDFQKNIFLTSGDKMVVTLDNLLPELVSDEVVPVRKIEREVREFLTETEPQISVIASNNRVYDIGVKTANFRKGNVTIAGFVRVAQTGEPVIGANVYITNPRIGVSTDQSGFYSLTLPAGRHSLNIRYIGMRDAVRVINLYSEGKLDVEMIEQVRSLKEVDISAEKVANIRSTQMGVEKLTMATIKQIPTVFGEPDILRVILTLPGVKSVGEASTGFNVRGGGTDQNLILYNDATIYNPTHLFGFFSAFNSDAVKDIELYKSSIPARFGGRISSVLDVRSREGNSKKIAGSAGIGLLTSRFNIEGPIIKDRTTFMLGGRTTYSDWLLGKLPEKSGYKNSKAAFSDIDVHLNHKFDDRNTLAFTGYLSNDRFNLNSDTVYSYSNRNLSLKWKHIFHNKFNMSLTAGIDNYEYQVESHENPINAYDMGFDINQSNFKADFTYYLSNKHTLDFGGSSILYKTHPGKFVPWGTESLVRPDILQSEQALESAVYLGDRFEITPALSLNMGLRFSLYHYLGPQSTYAYPEGLPKNDFNVTDSLVFNRGDVIKKYGGPEYRISARYAITGDMSVKLAFNTLRQYIHMLSNTTAIAPTDIWKLSDLHIKPQSGRQASFGLYKNFKSNTIETSAEVYYKWLDNYLDYRSGATLIMNHHLEQDVINTQGKAYGAEFQIKKTAGKLNGWISYTYSRTMLKMDDPTSIQLINGGKYYPANHDKPHDFTMVGNFKASHRFSVSANVTYSTGRPITLPVGRFYYGGAERMLYSDRNQYRIPDYFRTDLSMNIEGNHKVHQWIHSSWTIGVYNVTGRHNPYSTYFTTENGWVKGYKLSIFATPVPFINYNLRF